MALFLYSRRYEGLPETKYFQLLILMTTAWSALQAIDVSVTELGIKVLLTELKFVFIPYVCVGALGLVVSMSGHGDWLDRRRLIVISIVPAVTTAMALTAQWHTLFLYDFSVLGGGPVVLRASEGLWYWTYLIYSYALLVAALTLLVGSSSGSSSLYREQAMVMAVSFIPPIVFDIVQNLFGVFRELDLAPMTFTFSGIIIFWGLFRYRILDVCPVARGEVVENMTDAVLIVDGEERLIDLNRAARPLLPARVEKVIGTPVSEALPFGMDIAALLRSGLATGEVEAGTGAERRTLDLSVMPFRARGEIRAHMVLIRDVTDCKRAEEALRAANERLGILSSMTRHDVLNRLAVIDGYVSLALKENDPEKVRSYLERTERSSEAARSLIEFTGDYESLGIKAPSWLRIDDLFARAVGQFQLDRIEVTSSTAGLSVYADAMLEKVFYNLIDNTLRHGGKVSRISLEYEELPDRLALIYRDDGVGIAGKDKPLIFLRSFGANNGLGLFLVREVLAITGIEMVENGEEGRGARFEMLVPAGGFRIEPQADRAPTSIGKDAETAHSAH